MLLSWALVGPAGLGCADEPVPDGPRIDRLVPDQVAPGARLFVEGGGLGDGAGTVAIGGRPVPVLGWSAGTIEIAVPADLPQGETLVVATTAARQRTAPAPLTVLGANQRPDPVRRFPPTGDGAPGPDAGRPDGGPAPDLSVPDMDVVGPLEAVFTPDPAAGNAVVLTALDGEPGLLRLAVQVPRQLAPLAGGVALHLAYDPNLLTLQASAPAESAEVIIREIAPGRVALVRVDPPQLAAELTFRLVGRGEGRIDVPSRHRALRDLRNDDLPDVRWVGGTVRVQAVAP